MADKEIYIGGLRVGLGTGVKGSPEINNKSTLTFDGPKNVGTANVPHSLEISKLVSDSLDDHIALRKKMISMRSEPETISVKETIYGRDGGSFIITRHYFRCIVDGDDYEMSAEDLTSETLKFKAEGMEETYN